MEDIKRLELDHVKDVKVKVVYNEKIKKKFNEIFSKNSHTIIHIETMHIDDLIKEDRDYLATFKSYPSFVKKITLLKNGKTKILNFEEEIKNRDLKGIANKVSSLDKEGYLDSETFITWRGTELMSESINILIPLLDEKIYEKINKLTNLISLRRLFKHSCLDSKNKMVAKSPIAIKTKLYSKYKSERDGVDFDEYKTTTHYLKISDNEHTNKLTFAFSNYLIKQESINLKEAIDNDLPEDWAVKHMSNLLELINYDN